MYVSVTGRSTITTWSRRGPPAAVTSSSPSPRNAAASCAVSSALCRNCRRLSTSARPVAAVSTNSSIAISVVRMPPPSERSPPRSSPLEVQHRRYLVRRKAHPDVERTEKPVNGTGFVIAELVDDIANRLEVAREQSHPPLPIIDAGAGRNQLCHPIGVAPPGVPVCDHELLPLLELESIPVVLIAARFGHRVEAENGIIVRQPRVDARLGVHRRALPQRCKALRELGRAWIE